MNRPISTLTRYLVVGAIAMACMPLACANSERDNLRPDFPAWLANFKQQAAGAGISKATLDATLTGLRPNDRVLEYDRRQPEFV